MGRNNKDKERLLGEEKGKNEEVEFHIRKRGAGSNIDIMHISEQRWLKFNVRQLLLSLGLRISLLYLQQYKTLYSESFTVKIKGRKTSRRSPSDFFFAYLLFIYD